VLPVFSHFKLHDWISCEKVCPGYHVSAAFVPVQGVYYVEQVVRLMNFYCRVFIGIMSVALIAMAGGAQAQLYQDSSNPRPMSLKSLNIGRTFGPETSGTINQNTKVVQPRIISKTEWGGGESSGTMKSHFPSSLTVHHEGSPKPLTPDRDPKELLKNLQKYGWTQKSWPDLPYHYLIDLNGNIYEGRDPMKVGDTNTSYDPSGKLLVTMMGNTNIQAPTKAQLESMTQLMAWAADYYNIDPATIKGHLEYTSTGCPGKYLYPFVASGFFEGEVRRVLKEAYNPDPVDSNSE
jgi:hypothetical protein